MKRVRYVGPFDVVEFEDAHGLHFAKQGEVIEVADETAPGLLAQTSNWQPVQPKPKPKPAAANSDTSKAAGGTPSEKE